MSNQPIQRPQLSSDDQRLLDALVDSGFQLDELQLDPADRERAEAILRLMGLLTDYPVDDVDEELDSCLLDATMARIDRHDRQVQARHRMDPVSVLSLRRVRVPDFISIAASILIITAVTLPLLGHLRARSIDTRCANQLRQLSYSFGSYAADHRGQMPVSSAGLHSTWTRLADNVSNLMPLVENGYCSMGHLNCPGHDGEACPTYSYQFQTFQTRSPWAGGRVRIILGDPNPVIQAFRTGGTASPESLSVSHGGRGQNVLSSDGSWMWLEESVVGGDNIWMPKGGLQEGVGTFEAEDVFLAQ